jgi:hypothetical protein
MAAGYPPFFSENKVEIFKAICEARYTFPDHFSKVLTSASLSAACLEPILPQAQAQAKA